MKQLRIYSACCPPIRCRLSVMAPFATRPVSFDGLLKLAARSLDIVVISSTTLHNILRNAPGMEELSAAFPCRSSTLVAFMAPGERFGEKVVFRESDASTIEFPVPHRFRGEADAVLVVELPYYGLGPDGTLKVDESGIGIVRRFATTSGGYNLDAKHGLPFGERLFDTTPVDVALGQKEDEPSEEARRATRVLRPEHAMVTAVAYDEKGVLALNVPFSTPLGAIGQMGAL